MFNQFVAKMRMAVVAALTMAGFGGGIVGAKPSGGNLKPGRWERTPIYLHSGKVRRAMRSKYMPNECDRARLAGVSA